MTDRALSEEAMLASLHDIHLPAEAAGGFAADIAVVIGLASFAALLLVGVFRLVSLKARVAPVESPLAGLQDLPEADRRVALLHVLREAAPERYAAIRGAIYEPGGGVDLATLEAEVRARA
ncbi:hypothetical protein [uncultured Roseobacter sp.]|uniref:hypothetical protein n=1 Tax=uncultured Roseobacter sp. TaxID=114847 RepID=UPI0026138B78|nr:hypothetical protein [uncultured Roseobacter sp.]